MNVLHNDISYLTVLNKLNEMMQEKTPIVIGIDGNCASGKTSLGNFLSDFLDCNVIHMDDFFLPPALRTAKRLDEAGGNIHYERFYEEVVTSILEKKPITFRQFSCEKMDYQNEITLPQKALTIVEGSYCMREEFRRIYDYRIFMTCPYEEQLSRIRKRNGEEMLTAFIEKWIPMENKYFEICQIPSFCDMII